jgi:uncharacterized protein (DUF924 family)
MSSLRDFKLDWFANPQWWFSKDITYDDVIVCRYAHLLDETYIVEPTNDLLAIILVYDQLPRHLFRNTLSNHIINYYLKIVLRKGMWCIIESVSNHNVKITINNIH